MSSLVSIIAIRYFDFHNRKKGHMGQLPHIWGAPLKKG